MKASLSSFWKKLRLVNGFVLASLFFLSISNVLLRLRNQSASSNIFKQSNLPDHGEDAFPSFLFFNFFFQTAKVLQHFEPSFPGSRTVKESKAWDEISTPWPPFLLRREGVRSAVDGRSFWEVVQDYRNLDSRGQEHLFSPNFGPLIESILGKRKGRRG